MIPYNVFIIYAVFILSYYSSVASGYKIFAIFPLPVKSHTILGNGIVDSLLDAGHEVVYMTVFPREKPRVNLTYIDISSFHDEIKSKQNITKMLEDENMVEEQVHPSNGLDHADLVLTHPAVEQFLNTNSHKFDLIIAERFMSDIYSGFSIIYQTPIIFFMPVEINQRLLYLLGEIPNPAYTSSLNYKPFTPPFNYIDRALNLWNNVHDYYMYRSLVLPSELVMYTKHFGEYAKCHKIILPPYEKALESVSLVMTASHLTLSDSKILPQKVLDIGGLHIKKEQTMSPELLQKLETASHGVILFSLGSTLRSRDMSTEWKLDLLCMLGRLKQTVLWKFDENWSDRPDNVIIAKWFPQPAILKHPNVVAFITHGGLLSMTEAVHFAVPMIGIPVFADQFANMKRIESRGLGVQVKLSYNMSMDIEMAIHEILSNKRFKQNMLIASKMYHDRPRSSKHELLYWVNYVIKHRNTHHLSACFNTVMWYQYLCLDIVAILAIFIYSCSYLKKIILS